MQKQLNFYHVIWVDANYDGSFLLRNGVFSMGTFYSNVYGD
jgi:hypothetical protein